MTTLALVTLFTLMQPSYGYGPDLLPMPESAPASMYQAGVSVGLVGGTTKDGTLVGAGAVAWNMLSSRWYAGGEMSETGWSLGGAWALHIDPLALGLAFHGTYGPAEGWNGGASAVIAPYSGFSVFAGASSRQGFSYDFGAIYRSPVFGAWLWGSGRDGNPDLQAGVRMGGTWGGVGMSVSGWATRTGDGRWSVMAGLAFHVTGTSARMVLYHTRGHDGSWLGAWWNMARSPQPSLVWGLGAQALLIDLSSPDSLDMVRASMKVESCLQRPTCRAVIVKTEEGLPLATAEEVARLLDRVRRAGRFSMVYAYGLEDTTYAMASHADAIYLFPGTVLTFKGLSIKRIYVARLLEKAGIRVQLLRIGEYKSAPEMFTRSSPSPQSFDSMSRILKEAERQLVLMNRRFGLRRYRSLVDRVVLVPPVAKEMKLIDGTAYPEELASILSRRLGEDVSVVNSGSFPSRRTYGTVGVCLLVLQGDIVAGDAGPLTPQRSVIAARPVARALKECSSNPRIAGILIRIDSPGGSALASEYLWNVVRRIRKPVVVSVGRRAASGGYYIAVGGDRILSLRSSLVGSIGVFGGKVDVSAIMARLGISTTVLRRGPHADLTSPFRPYDEEEKRVVLARLGWLYQRFVKAVSHRKGLDITKVGAGRVFLGSEALPLHMVDGFGSFMDAWEALLAMADLPRMAPVYLAYPSGPSMVQRALARLVPGMEAHQWPLSLVVSPSPWARTPVELIF